MCVRCLVMLFSLSLLAPPASAADWWNWRGPLMTGVSPEKNLPDHFGLDPKNPDDNLLWRAPYGCRSTPLVMNGRVFIINNVGRDITEQERVMCFDADTGKVLWEHKFNVWHTDIVSARLGWTNLAGDPKTGNIYAHGTQGMLICFNRDGKVVWQRSLTEEFGRVSGYGGRIVSPVVADDLVIVSMNNTSWGDQAKGATRFLALDKDTGAVVWWADPVGQPKDSYYSTPVVAVVGGRKQVIGGCGEGSVVGIDLATGKTLWRYQLGTAMVNCSPVVSGDFVFIAHGEENSDNNILGRVVCLDAGNIVDGHPVEVWKTDGIRARYASPLVEGGRLYIADDVAKLFCLDAKTGKRLWSFAYGRSARGSPLWADGKLYVGEVAAKFHILKPGPKKCERLFEMEFFDPDGKADIEINGTPAAAHGRVYFTTSEGVYCIGTPEGRKVTAPLPAIEGAVKKGGGPAHAALFPADIVLHPGESASFQIKSFDAFGNRIMVKAVPEWSLPTPPVPPGAKSGPPALKGELVDGKLTVDAKVPAQQGYVEVKFGGLTARARVRVAPRLPYVQDFDKVPTGAVPGGWINTQGKFLVKDMDGGKALAKVTDKPSPLIARGNAYIGLPTDRDYVIEADVMGQSKVVKVVGDDGTVKLIEHRPDFGIVANRYTLFIAGNVGEKGALRIASWDALPRLDRTIPFDYKSGEWYRMKLAIDLKGGEATVKGKCWPRGQPEPSDWIIDTHDPIADSEGAPGLYGYVRGNLDGSPGTDIYYDNIRITPNKK